MSGAPLIDRAVVADLVEAIGDEGARSVIELFIAEMRGHLATIAAAAADPTMRDEARRAAHSLKSGAGQVGAAAIAAAAIEVERAAAAAAPLTEMAAVLHRDAAATEIAFRSLLDRS